MTETELSRSIRASLSRAGFWPMRVNSGGFRARSSGAPAGTPDICLIDLGAWLEVKLPGRELDEAQREWHEKATKRGVKVATVSNEIDAVRIAIEWRDS